MLNIYLDTDVLGALIGKDFGEAKMPHLSMTVEIENMPLTGIITMENDELDVKVYIRDEMKTNSNLYREASFPIGSSANSDNTDQIVLLVTLAYKAAGLHLQDKGLLDSACDLDEESSGVLFTVDSDNLVEKFVSGKERPDLLCTTLFGDTEMRRPYMDEVMDAWMMESLPIEEKIEAAEAGDEDMMEQLAIAYLNGDEVDEDPQKAVYWFEKLAELDNSTAQFNLGLHYAKGHGVARDFEKAAYWMERAAENGDEDAPALVEKYRKAVAALEKIPSGDAQAQADLAGVLMALAGSLDQAGPGKDYEEAFSLAQKAAEKGNGDGLWTLALAYEHGRGVDENVDMAIECYEKGAALGHAACQHSLGCYFARGDYLSKNNKKAFELFSKSAAQGYGLAMKDLGRCYQFGTGCMGNMKTALEWYTKASDVLNDPDLDQRVMAFQSLANIDPHWGEDYPGEDDLDED